MTANTKKTGMNLTNLLMIFFDESSASDSGMSMPIANKFDRLKEINSKRKQKIPKIPNNHRIFVVSTPLTNISAPIIQMYPRNATLPASVRISDPILNAPNGE